MVALVSSEVGCEWGRGGEVGWTNTVIKMLVMECIKLIGGHRRGLILLVLVEQGTGQVDGTGG